MTVRIVLADDHKIMRDGIRSLLAEHKDLLVVGEADNGESAVDLAEKVGPHLMIMDVGMPDLNGVEATRKICSELDPPPAIIGLSMHADQNLIAEMFKAGAKGYLPKDCAGEELIDAVRQVEQGKTYLSPAVTEGLVDGFVRNQTEAEPDSAFRLLSPREREVLQLISEGSSTKEVAAQLSISVRTAETHRRNIMDKLNLRSVAELTKYAIRTGLTTLDT